MIRSLDDVAISIAERAAAGIESALEACIREEVVSQMDEYLDELRVALNDIFSKVTL